MDFETPTPAADDTPPASGHVDKRSAIFGIIVSSTSATQMGKS